MKTIAILFVFFLAAMQALFAQDSITMYFDKDWKEIQDKNVAQFYRKAIAESNGTYVVRDYYINGQIQMKGAFSSKKFKEKTGHFVYYAENGHKISEGECLKNKDEGQWTYWYDTDIKKAEGKYSSGKKVDVWTYYNKNGILNAKEFITEGITRTFEMYYCNGNPSFRIEFVGSSQNTGTYYSIDGKPTLTGRLVNGQRDGEWIRTFPDGEMKLLFKYGELMSKPIGGIIHKQ